MFSRAVKKNAKLRLALFGPSGSGKTYSALLIAKGLGGKIAVIDTERGSASLYSDEFEFDTLSLSPPFSPERYVEAIQAAESGGYDTLIIDSVTHEWNGSGGCLEINDQIARVKFKGNSWSAWSETNVKHNRFIDAIMQSKMDIIVTGRSKTETAQTDDGGKKKIIKLGMKAEQRDGFEYEFTCVLDLLHDGHYAVASKDRMRLFKDPFMPGVETGAQIKSWLESTHHESEDLSSIVEHTLCDIKSAIERKDYPHAAWAWEPLSDSDKRMLWKHLSQGEREFMKSKEFKECLSELSEG